jgi:hypothetical protein
MVVWGKWHVSRKEPFSLRSNICVQNNTMKTTLSEMEIQQWLERLRPPEFPDEAFDPSNANLNGIVSWKKSVASAMLAGLLTEPNFHANGIRLDWLQRLVLSKAVGQRKPQSREFSDALNEGLASGNVLRLEDPIEDLFCDVIVTTQGNFRIFTGLWEGAGPYTQTLFGAFESLPDGSLKNQAIGSAYALLRVSEAVAARANVNHFNTSGGEPQGRMIVPTTDDLKLLARRVRFSDGDLASLQLDKDELTPFFLQAENLPFVSDRPAGETPLEFYPLLSIPTGIVVVSPQNISLAVRAVFVNAAKAGGMADALLYAMLVKQQEYSESSGFWPVSSLRLSPPNQYSMRASVCQYAQGRFLHVIQIPATFDDFPERAFGSVRELGRTPSQFVAADISRFWQYLRERDNYRSSVTVLLLSGWGTPHSVAPPIDEANIPPNWTYLPISFCDAAVLGSCDDGKFRDIVRLLQQVERLEGEGFAFQNLNGIVNLFGFWRTTEGNLIPEHLTEIAPPCNLALPTDELLKPRIEAAKKRDICALPLVGGGYKVVQRLDWSDIDDLKPVYASPDDAMRRRLIGAAVFDSHVWWVECIAASDQDGDWQYRIWHALFQWLAVVGPAVIDAFPAAFPGGPREVEVLVPPRTTFVPMDATVFSTANIRSALTSYPSTEGSAARLEITEAWLTQLGTANNDAEVELVAALLELLASADATTRSGLAGQVRAAIGSGDWRWLHAREAFTPLDLMVGSGLVGSFKEMSFSAHALAKCQSVWAFRNRAEGLEISGEENCKSFLATYRESLLGELISRIRTMSRSKLMLLCGQQYQAARAEQEQWRSTIRAMRAIRGDVADATAFKRQNAINAIQRAAKSVCEVAACEAAVSGGIEPNRLDLEELFALALLLFSNGQLFASIRAGIIEPTLKISPAGDLLSERSAEEIALRPAAEWSNRKVLDEAAEAYPRRRVRAPQEPGQERLPWSGELRAAVETEYGASAEAFIDLQFAIIRMAEARQEGVFLMRRGELAATLNANDRYPSTDTSALVERLTLPHRRTWEDKSIGLSESDIDLSRFDRPYSIINRPLLAMDDEADPLLLVAPIFISDACMYSLSGLMNGNLNNKYWVSGTARAYAGAQGNAAGERFEDEVADRLKTLNLEAWPRRTLSWALNEKVDPELGNIDVLAVSGDRRRVWVIEAKSLRLCRTEAEIASRFSEYRGRVIRDVRGRDRPDKMLRHIRRVEYLRARRATLCSRLKLDDPPEVRGLLVVDAPQPMNFFAIDQFEDGQTAILDEIESFKF